MKNTLLILTIAVASITFASSCNGGAKDKHDLSNSEESFDDIINGSTPVIVDFYADWCKPCKLQGPIIDELASEMGDQVRVVKVNVDYEDQLANRYGIQSIPTIMVFKEGKTIWKAVGVQEKSTLQKVVLDAQ
ncbi:MAG: thioredoxin [Marinilabiliales bacterium]|nr:MAG: thioredoxin [Marinilabiliales bacterium]